MDNLKSAARPSTFVSITFLYLAFFLSLSAQGQSNRYATIEMPSTFEFVPYGEEMKNAPSTVDPILILGESRAAQFEGGEEDLEDYLNTQITYPDLAQANGIEGTTIVRFRIMSDGSLERFIILQSTHAVCDQAVIKALKQMPAWNPALHNGQAVATWRAVSVDFYLAR